MSNDVFYGKCYLEDLLVSLNLESDIKPATQVIPFKHV